MSTSTALILYLKPLVFGPPSFDTFHPFPELPPELRRRIWKEAEPEGRVVEIEWSHEKRAWFSPHASRDRKPSGLYRSCKESRAHILEKWSKLMPYSPDPKPGAPVLPHDFQLPFSFFNPEVDTLYIGSVVIEQLSPEAILRLAAIASLRNLRKLACCEVCYYCFSAEYQLFDNPGPLFVIAFPKLQKFTLVAVGDMFLIGGWDGETEFEGDITLRTKGVNEEDHSAHFGIFLEETERELAALQALHPQTSLPQLDTALIERGTWTEPSLGQ